MSPIKSAFLRIGWKDIRRGLGLAATASGTYLFSTMVLGTVPDVGLFKSTGSVFVGTCGTYVLKNLLTNSQDEFLKNDPAE